MEHNQGNNSRALELDALTQFTEAGGPSSRINLLCSGRLQYKTPVVREGLFSELFMNL
jgi:hypothetical protein